MNTLILSIQHDADSIASKIGFGYQGNVRDEKLTSSMESYGVNSFSVKAMKAALEKMNQVSRL